MANHDLHNFGVKGDERDPVPGALMGFAAA
jgi:hypothetical protein